MKKKLLDKSGSEGKKPLYEVSQAISEKDNVKLPFTQPSAPPKPAELKTEVGKPTLKPSLGEQYYTVCNAVTDAFATINFFGGSKAMGQTLKHSKERNKEQPLYMERLQTFVAATAELPKLFTAADRTFRDVFKNTNLARFQVFLSKLLHILAPLKGQDADNCKLTFTNYANFLATVFNNANQLESFRDVAQDKSSSIIKNFRLYQKLMGTTEFPEQADIYVTWVAEINGLIKIKHGVLSDVPTLLHNIEKTLLEFRLAVAIRHDADFIRVYFQINRDLINIQIRMLEFYSQNSAVAIGLWPSMNRDLVRIFHQEAQFAPSQLIQGYKESLKLWNDEFAKELLPLVNVINELDKIEAKQRSRKMELGIEQVSDDLTGMLDLYNDETCRQNPLLKALVLANIINCYTVKNDVFISGKTDITLPFVMRSIKYLDEFVGNLAALQEVWGGQLFQFLNNFIFIKNYIHIVISASEHALLLCEILFEKAGQDMELKKQIIDFQISLIDKQNDLLNFLNDNRENKNEKEYVRKFYFKRQGKKELDSYNTYKANILTHGEEESSTVIHGIPVEEVIDRNNLRRLKLEAIHLEFLSGHRLPVDADYANALSEAELKKYQEDIDKEKEKKALKEKEQKDQGMRKKKGLQKLAEKNAKKAKDLKTKTEVQKKRKDEGKGEMPDAQPMVRLEQNSADLALSNNLNQLLLKLSPGAFDADGVKLAIVGLHDMLQQSDNHLVKFKVLSGMGDSYGTIVAHDLNHGAKHPKQLIVDLKIALNYYKQAELTLRKITDISFKDHQRYYTWLVHSITIQEQLLEQYTMKFGARLAKLRLSRLDAMDRLGEDWKRPKDKVSHYTTEREDLLAALDEVAGIETDCKQIKTRIKQNDDLAFGGNAYYAFQHILDNSGGCQLPDEPPTCRLELCEEDDLEQEEASPLATLSAGVESAPEAPYVGEIAPPDPTLVYRNYRCTYHNGVMIRIYNVGSDPLTLAFMPIVPIPLCLTYVPPFAGAVGVSEHNSSAAAIPDATSQKPPQITLVPQVKLESPGKEVNQLGRDLA